MTLRCFACGDEFDGPTGRTMHVIRKRCPEVKTEADADSLDNIHALQEALGAHR